MTDYETWEVRLYETQTGQTPVLEFLVGLPPRHRAKVRQAIGRLEAFGPRLGFPDTSAVKDTPFRELRTRDLRDAVRASEKYLRDYRSRATEG